MYGTVVLAVGNDPLLLETRSRVLRSAGYTVTEALSLEQAIAQFKQRNFSLVILCHSVPPGDREKLCQILRREKPGVPIVSVAPYSDQHDTFVDATVDRDPDRLVAGLLRLLRKDGNGFSSATTPARGGYPVDGGRTQETILYVDDDRGVRDGWATLLERAGYKVLMARDGAEALRLLVAETVDAVVLHHELPGMNDGQFAAQIRQIKSGVPVMQLHKA